MGGVETLLGHRPTNLNGAFGRIAVNLGFMQRYIKRKVKSDCVHVCGLTTEKKLSDAICLQQCTTFPAGKDTRLGRGGVAGELVLL